MQLSAFKTFLTIVETGSLVRASERLNVTQSTVTARLRTLEDALGQTLMHRDKRGITLTSAGLKFKRYAEVMLDLWWQAQQETSLPDGVTETCNIGCHMDLWPTLGQPLFDHLADNQPETALAAWPGNQAALESWLANGVIDVGLGYQPSSSSDQVSLALPTETLILVSPDPDASVTHHPGYIYVDAGEQFARSHTEAYTDAAVAKINHGSTVWALSHLLKHGGSAYLPERLVADHLANNRLYRLDAPAFERAAYFLVTEARAETWAGLHAWLIDSAEQALHELTP